MAQVKVLNWKKQTVGQVDLPDIFEQKVNLGLLNEVVRWQRAGRRQGTHKAKTRAEVSGGGKKPFRQKGTGNARQGSSRSPLNVAGGATFGPRPRKYDYALPAQVRAKGLWQALSYLWQEKKIFVMENMLLPSGKTKELFQQLKSLGVQRALLVDKDCDPLFKRACANLKSFQFLPVVGLNVYDLLKYDCLVMSQSSIDFLINRANKVKEEKPL